MEENVRTQTRYHRSKLNHKTFELVIYPSLVGPLTSKPGRPERDGRVSIMNHPFHIHPARSIYERPALLDSVYQRENQ